MSTQRTNQDECRELFLHDERIGLTAYANIMADAFGRDNPSDAAAGEVEAYFAALGEYREARGLAEE